MTFAFLPGNRIDLLETGAAFFPALIAAVDAAGEEVRLETYIFADDATGRTVAAALARAAARGVRVRVLVDGFGARDFMTGIGGELAARGVEVLVYRPEVALLRLRRHRLRRLHRKLAAIDARIAFVGGINIIDDSNTPGQVPPRYDYAVRIEGPLLGEIDAAMHHLWHMVRWASFRRRHGEPPALRPASTPRGATRAAFMIRDNLRHRRDIEDAYLEAIAAARHEIVLAHAYFLPGHRFRHALMAAAGRGVRVIVLLQGRVEYVLLHYASQALYGALLGAGIRLYEYRKSFLSSTTTGRPSVRATSIRSASCWPAKPMSSSSTRASPSPCATACSGPWKPVPARSAASSGTASRCWHEPPTGWRMAWCG